MTPLANPSVLIVDDEQSIRVTVGMLLRGEGLTVREANGVSTAIALVDREPFDLVITDLRLGDADGGLEVLKAGGDALIGDGLQGYFRADAGGVSKSYSNARFLGTAGC